MNTLLYPSDKIVNTNLQNGFLRGYGEDGVMIRPLTRYHPTFPLPFYDMWEIINRTKYINKKEKCKILIICDDIIRSLGWAEAVLYYRDSKNYYLLDDDITILYFNNDDTIKNINAFKINELRVRKTYKFEMKACNGNKDILKFVEDNFSKHDLLISNIYYDFFDCIRMVKTCPIKFIIISEDETLLEKKLQRIKLDISNFHFLISDEEKISKKEINKYFDWCRKYGIDLIEEKISIREHVPKFIHKDVVTFPFVIPIMSIKKKEDINNKNWQPFLKLKMKLNKYKRLIDTREQSGDIKEYVGWKNWNTHTNKIDLLKSLKYELYNVHNINSRITNAWTKFYEILIKYPQLTNYSLVKSFHICEAPGAFIFALYEFAKLKKLNLEWLAQSLNPYSKENQEKFPSMLSDQFEVIKECPDKWLFGKDTTGNIMNIDNIKHYKKHVKGINLMTADGGLQSSPHLYNEQEAHVSKLIYAEVLTILAVLEKNGCAVIKMFIPIAEPITISTLFLLSCCFEKVEICKPMTSHASNSEMYVICINYKKPELDLKKLFKRLNNKKDWSRIPILPLELIPSSFLKSLYEIAKKLVDLQIRVIDRSLVYHELYIPKIVEKYKKMAVDKWIKNNLLT